MKLAYRPDLILVEQGVEQSPVAQSVLTQLPQVPVEYFDDSKPERNILSANLAKRKLILKKHKGRFFKYCPGSLQCYTCCDLYTLNLTQNCPYACTYCFLQDYMNQHTMTQFVNLEDLFSELDQMLSHEIFS